MRRLLIGFAVWFWQTIDNFSDDVGTRLKEKRLEQWDQKYGK